MVIWLFNILVPLGVPPLVVGQFMYKGLCKLLSTHTKMFCMKPTTPLTFSIITTFSIIAILSAKFFTQLILPSISLSHVFMALGTSITQIRQIVSFCLVYGYSLKNKK